MKKKFFVIMLAFGFTAYASFSAATTGYASSIKKMEHRLVQAEARY